MRDTARGASLFEATHSNPLAVFFPMAVYLYKLATTPVINFFTPVGACRMLMTFDLTPGVLHQLEVMTSIVDFNDIDIGIRAGFSFLFENQKNITTH